MLQSPEIELLLLCARPQMTEDAIGRIHSLLEQEVDWREIFRLAGNHRIIPMLALHLREHATDLLADDIQSELQEHHRDSTQHNLILAMELLRLIDLFKAAGINVVPFKGTVSAMLSYGDMALRACGDIDLLVLPDNHDKAEKLLEAEGYSVKERYQDALQSTLLHEQRRIYIDLHWGIPAGFLRLDTAPLWEDLTEINLLDRPLSTFSRCDTLLVMAINATKEYWRPSLHHLSEIAALTGSYTDGDWMVAFHRARRIGCQRMLVAALLFAHRLLDMELPSAGPVRLFSHRGINRVVDELQDHLFLESGEQKDNAAMQLIHHASAQSYYLSLTDSSLRRSSDWLKWAVTPNSSDKAVIKLPAHLSFLYYFVRPLRLLVKRWQ
jgi:hypothetical protein